LVWVIAHVAGGVPEGAFAHRAKVVGTDGRWLECEFDNPHIITNGASGAPVIDARGHVVGIYQGHADENGHKIAYIIAAPLIIETLRQL
jgi:S1-C subfamily serine protease